MCTSAEVTVKNTIIHPYQYLLLKLSSNEADFSINLVSIYTAISAKQIGG